MAIPTITQVTPSTGRTGGRALVTIYGTNFRLPTPPPALGNTTGLVVAPSVKVSFVGSKATRVSPQVRVLSSTQLLVTTPYADGEAHDVLVQNINDSGVLIGGESATLTGGYLFQAPDLAPGGQALADPRFILVRVSRALLQDLKRQVLGEVSLTVHTEYDGNPSDDLNIIEYAKLPALVLVGPTLRTNRMYARNDTRDTQDPFDPTVFYKKRPSKTRDLYFEVLGASNTNMQCLALLQEVEAYFERNPYLDVPADGLTLTNLVRYEMQVPLSDDFEVTTKPGTDNVFQFKGSCIVRGVELDEEDMAIYKGRQVADIVMAGADGTVVVPSAAIVGSAASTPIGQGSQNPYSPLPSGIDYEQIPPKP